MRAAIPLLLISTFFVSAMNNKTFDQTVREKLADHLLSKSNCSLDMMDIFSAHLQYLLELEQEPVKQLTKNNLLMIFYKKTPYFYDTQSRKIMEIRPHEKKASS